MRDYMPNPNPRDPNRGYDRYGNISDEPIVESARGPYILLGILVAIGLIGGLLYFNGAPKDRNDTARLPDTTLSAPVPPHPALPRIADPAPAAPARAQQ